MRILLVTFALVLFAAMRAWGDERPNIVLFVADDMTYTDAGCYGNPDVKTPNLDRLATEGMRFTHAFTNTAMCSPARQILYTGLYPQRSGAYPQRSRIYDDVQTLPTILQEMGYDVALAGKTHYAPMEQYPFELLGGTPLELDRIPEFINRSEEKPFCLVVCSNQPHTPWDLGDPAQYDADSLTLPPYFADTPRTRELMTNYYGEVTFLDGQVGTVLSMLEESGKAEDTLFMFLSEQGSSAPFAKWTLYDAGIRAQCIVRWPGHVEAGSVTNAFMSYTDVLPTFVDLAEGETDIEFDGVSLVPVLTSKTDTLRERVYGIHTNLGINNGNEYPIRSVRDRKYKLIWNLTPEVRYRNNLTEEDREWYFFQSWRDAAAEGDEEAAQFVARFEQRPEFELYDVSADPYELTNLAEEPEHAATVERMRGELEAWMSSVGDLGVETEKRALERHRDGSR